MKTTPWLGAVLATSLLLPACDLDLDDPNSPTEEVVLNDPTGLLAIGIGLQAEYAEAIDLVYVPGLITDEIGAGPQTFLNLQNADIGEELDAATDMSVAPWTELFRVIKLSNDLIRLVPEAALEAGTKSGLLALARLHRAMAYGWLVQLYGEAPLTAGIDNPEPSFDSREAVLAEVIALLEQARADLAASPASAQFNAEVLAPGFNLPNTIDAMLARYNLIAGNYQAAITAAQRVTAPSELRFSTSDRNSVHNLIFRSLNTFFMRPEQTFRTQAEAGDRRVQYWIIAANIAGAHNRTLDDLNKYRLETDPFPLYLPDEMKLIQAEAHARLNQLAQARTLINQVRTQCFTGTGDPPEPMPCLPALSDAQLATQAAILDEILKQRRYELFLQGLLYEDLRRFGRTLKYPWVPFPLTECDRNANAPC